MIRIEPIRCKSCLLCIEFCQKDVLELSDTFNSQGYRVVRAARPEDCNSCGLCALMCPEAAITVYEEEHASRQQTKEA